MLRRDAPRSRPARRRARSPRPQPATEVDVLAVHEEPLVEAAELDEGVASHEDAGARDPVGRPTPCVGVLVANELVRPRRPREHAVEEERLGIRRSEAREQPLREVERAVVVDDPRRDGTDARFLVEHPCECAQRRRVDPGVRVQDEHVRGGSLPPPALTPVAKPPFRESWIAVTGRSGRALEASVGRGVVDDDDVGVRGRQERLHARRGALPAVVRDDDDVD